MDHAQLIHLIDVIDVCTIVDFHASCNMFDVRLICNLRCTFWAFGAFGTSIIRDGVWSLCFRKILYTVTLCVLVFHFRF